MLASAAGPWADTANTGFLACVLARIGHTVTCYDADESLQLTTSAQEAADLVIVTLARLLVWKRFPSAHTNGRWIVPTTVSYEVEQQIRLTLHKYCEAIDTADFDAFAALFERGRWFMVSQPGSQPVRDWLAERIVLYDGQTYTRHEISNLSIRPTESPDEATFNCYVAIWQDLPEEPPKLMAHVQFDGSFQRSGESWWWSTHTAAVQYAGDLSGHIKGGLA